MDQYLIYDYLFSIPITSFAVRSVRSSSARPATCRGRAAVQGSRFRPFLYLCILQEGQAAVQGSRFYSALNVFFSPFFLCIHQEEVVAMQG